jgi:EAL domain-containing protein (putative c-di-GMP-specific phosphodiesterase class I)
MASGSAPGGFHVDEVGLGFVVLGEFRLRTACLPIYRPERDRLTLVSVAATTVAERGGRAVSPSLFHLAVPASERAGAVGDIARMHAHNIASIDDASEGLDVLLDVASFDAQALAAEVRAIVAEADAAGVARSRIVVDLGDVQHLEQQGCDIVALVMGEGAGIALELAAASRLLASRRTGRTLRVARVKAPWLRSMAREPALLRLLAPTVGVLAKSGVATQIEGIDTPEMLRAALAAGAQRLQGSLLGRARLAGEAIVDAELDVGRLLRPPRSTAPLRLV